MPRYNYNALNTVARKLVDERNFRDALKIYFFMIDGDSTLEAGFYGERIGYCYEKLGDLHAAKYWYGRASEENPVIEVYRKARERLEHVGIDDLIKPSEYTR
ncbi:hypothetical protein [Microvirga lotononidis]|uniref:Sel1 repeat protein n=1 Tax=Microvirga lotononidis TaxID=864069 RepID=I4YYR1_9HYPH|nr:hypothetical protein [Microvirga lotononidis]EIM29103.1 hypothetical protein MicloDRAFT_00015740 [Microvirga lotononidis]WQO28949.1 hypothetical protein U0023_07715 [Microvirga lotononidis]